MLPVYYLSKGFKARLEEVIAAEHVADEFC